MSKPMLTELFASGYTVLPTPRQVSLTGETVAVGSGFVVLPGPGIKRNDIAVQSLSEQLESFTGLPVGKAGRGRLTVSLSVNDKTVASRQPDAIRRQGYLLQIAAGEVKVRGNSGLGLFYGVQTLVQLLKFVPGPGWSLPAGRIEDWPDLEVRAIHYDTKHHQETLDGVKQIIGRAAHYKINMIIWEIEDKFAYVKHPLIAAPGAFTAAEMKELTRYALARGVQIAPILQMPSHNAFIGKHKQYQHLLEHKTNNYMLCPSNLDTIKLYKELLAELIDATPGCEYVHLGTDEAYFLGQGDDCPCREKVKTMEQGGIFTELVNTLADFVKARGRTAMYWGESPMQVRHIKQLPPGTVNAVLREPEASVEYKKRGIRELVYTPAQGVRLFFPDYWPCRSGRGVAEGRLVTMTNKIRADGHREDNVLGTLIAAWDDSGLNSETFWLGWAAASAVGWNPAGADPDEAVVAFVSSFYGPAINGMEQAYLLLHEAADFWVSVWEHIPSRRGPSFMRRYHARRDLSLALPLAPDPLTLDNRPFWRQKYAPLLARACEMQLHFQRLILLLHSNIHLASRNRHNLAVLLSIARLLEHVVVLLDTLGRVEDAMNEARKAWDVVRPNDALASLRSASGMLRKLIADREDRYQSLLEVWERTRKPKGMSDGEKTFVHIQDDTKNHTGDHTPDAGYLVEAYRNLNLEGLAERIDAAAGQFAEKYGAIEPEPDYMQD